MDIIKKTYQSITASYVKTRYKDTGNHKHFHDDYSIVYVVEGNHTFENKNAKYEIDKDTIRIINPKEYHKTYNTNWTYINFMLPKQYVNDIASYIFDKDITDITFTSVIKDKKANELFERLNTALTQENSEYIEIDILCIEFMEYMIQNYSHNDIHQHTYTNLHNDMLQKIKEYIDNNFAQKITLDDIADHIKCNKFQILREFKKHYGITPYQHILTVRANKAKQMMLEDIPLSQITFECGFSDQSNMIKNFKKIYNYTPSLVKKNLHRFTY